MEAKDLKHFVKHVKADYRRIKLQYRTFFTLKEKNRGWEECTLLNINRNLKGVAIQFHTDKEIKVNSVITIDLSTTEEFRPACITGIVRWVKQTESEFTGGIELMDTNPKLKKVLS